MKSTDSVWNNNNVTGTLYMYGVGSGGGGSETV
jgi:hypothetical protein